MTHWEGNDQFYFQLHYQLIQLVWCSRFSSSIYTTNRPVLETSGYYQLDAEINLCILTSETCVTSNETNQRGESSHTSSIQLKKRKSKTFEAILSSGTGKFLK